MGPPIYFMASRPLDAIYFIQGEPRPMGPPIYSVAAQTPGDAIFFNDNTMLPVDHLFESQADDSPEPTNRMEDHPTPPELSHEETIMYDTFTDE